MTTSMPTPGERRAALVRSDPRWAALTARDPAADASFFYSVATTGVYCRPSCAARTPRPENVAFYDSAAAAERAGFRPCLRCRPDQPSLSTRQAALVARLCRRIESAEQPPSLASLAAEAGLSPQYLHRLFKSVTGLTPRAYAAAHRERRLRGKLSDEAGTVTAAIYDAGYGSSGRFYEQAQQVLGMKPSEYKQGGAALEIRFATSRCSLGAILVAATARGVCAISLGDDPEALVRELEQRFPRARLLGENPEFTELVQKVIGLVESPRLSTALPLDVRGTAFQQRVWQALREIPVGTTTSYAALASAIGRPEAIRAVASAIAANTVAVAIPCHRVVRSDGSLCGYRWGAERKRALLRREGQR